MPNINGGYGNDDGYQPADPNDPRGSEFELPKVDFENLEARMYLVLKALSEPVPRQQVLGVMKDLDQEMGDLITAYEVSLGPLPDWAFGFNVLREIKQGAQLQTKDGRQIGNAWVTSNPSFAPVQQGEAVKRYFDVFTDAGSKCTLSEAEINQMFHIGPYLCEPAHVFRHFGRPD